MALVRKLTESHPSDSRMIEKLPYWKNPTFASKERELAQNRLKEKFAFFLNFPHYFGSLYAFSWLENETPIEYFYTFSDGSRHVFELSHQDIHPQGNLVLEVTIKKEDNQHILKIHNLRNDIFMIEHEVIEVMLVEEIEQEFDSEFHFSPEEGEDWALSAPEESLFYYEQKKKFEQEMKIQKSEFRDEYLNSLIERNQKVDELRLDKLNLEIVERIFNEVPFYTTSLSQTPSLKTGQKFAQHFLIDKVSDKDLSRLSNTSVTSSGITVFSGVKVSDIGIWRSHILNGVNGSYRNQPIVFIQSDGVFLWNTREDFYDFSLQIVDALTKLYGSSGDSLFTVENELVAYDSKHQSEGDLILVRIPSNKLVEGALNLLNSLVPNLFLGASGNWNKQSGVISYEGENCKIQIYEQADLIFTSALLGAFDDLAR